MNPCTPEKKGDRNERGKGVEGRRCRGVGAHTLHGHTKFNISDSLK